MFRISYSLSRGAAVAAVAVVAGGALTACGSSSTSAGQSVSGAPSTSTEPSMTTTEPGTGSSVGGALTTFCTGLKQVDLTSLQQAKDPASAERAWAQLAADSPDAIKGDMQTIDTYLKAAISRDYTTLSSSVGQIQTAVTHIATYIGTNCHG